MRSSLILHPESVPRMPTLDASERRERNQRIAELQAELSALTRQSYERMKPYYEAKARFRDYA